MRLLCLRTTINSAFSVKREIASSGSLKQKPIEPTRLITKPAWAGSESDAQTRSTGTSVLVFVSAAGVRTHLGFCPSSPADPSASSASSPCRRGSSWLTVAQPETNNTVNSRARRPDRQTAARVLFPSEAVPYLTAIFPTAVRIYRRL